MRRLPRGIAALLGAASLSLAEAPRVLHVAADPNNLPFTNQAGEGFENKLVALLAADLGATVEYTWHAQRRGFIRETMKQGPADLVAGVPRGFEMTLNTAPYYRSTYVFVSRADRRLDVRSFDDPRLKTLRIGVEMIGDDFANTPPAHALSQRGIINNVRGFAVYGDYRQPNPPARIIDAVRRGDIDLACVWGPLAGFMAKEHPGEFTLTPLPERDPLSGQPFAFDICVGVKKSEPALRAAIQAILVRRKAEIDALLTDYGVPRVGPEGATR